MNLTRAAELPIEARGESTPLPGSVKDWQADRLAAALVKVEKVFDQAIAEQQKTAPVPGDVLVQMKSTLSDMQQAGKHDVKAAKELTESADRFLASFEVNQVLPQIVRDGAGTELIAGQIAQVANREFAQNAFYGVSQDACSSNARLEAMCDRAHALVKAGYIGEKELEGVQVSLADSASAKARAAESFASIARSAGLSAVQGAKEESRLLFVDDTSKLATWLPSSKPTIFVSEEEAVKLVGADPDAAAKAFSHELGHWLARDKTPQMLAAGIEGVTAAGGPAAADVAAFFKPDDLKAERLNMLTHKDGGLLTQELRVQQIDEKTWVGMSWTKTVKEMQGDLMSLAVENAVNGKASAIENANKLASVRDLERLDALAGATTMLKDGTDARLVRFGEEHHTSAAIRDFADRIKAGDLDKVQTPQQLDKLTGESIVRGLVQEYTTVRSAELNIHHVENGRAIPGVPPGVDLKAVLAAEMNSGFNHVPGTPTFLLAEKPPAAAFNNAPGVALEVGSREGAGSGQRFWLTTKAPGVPVPDLPAGTQQVAGREVASTMVALAKDSLAASLTKELTGPAPGASAASVDSTKLPRLSDAGPGAKQPTAQAKAEMSQPAPAMSM